MYECLCPTSGFTLNENKTMCEAIDPCQENPCHPQNLEKCVSSGTSYSCICKDGYNLDYTKTRCLSNNYCDANSCQNGTVCLNGADGFECGCTEPAKVYDKNSSLCVRNDSPIDSVPNVISIGGTLSSSIEILSPICPDNHKP